MNIFRRFPRLSPSCNRFISVTLIPCTMPLLSFCCSMLCVCVRVSCVVSSLFGYHRPASTHCVRSHAVNVFGVLFILFLSFVHVLVAHVAYPLNFLFSCTHYGHNQDIRNTSLVWWYSFFLGSSYLYYSCARAFTDRR